ncbi:unnamed protein product, partial [Mesorhabditis belari]|uniref:CX domain-containing protein n=1 Tax=Mesorhabditis belari TaxID=2138241 RepID=A0AAF3ERQ4_9BILA
MDLRSLVRAKRTTEILLQGESHGIIYEGYDKAFIQCIFEEGTIQGRNERYEFRCDASLQCCGRSCCIPEDATIPLWLLILFIILASLIALALLATLAYLLAQKLKNRPKKQTNAYQTLTDNGLDKSHLMEEEKYSSPYAKFVPSPMSEENLKSPQAVKIIQRSEHEISRAGDADVKEIEPLVPQRAQKAFYRPFVADAVEELDMPRPLRDSVSHHSIAEISQARLPQVSAVEQPKGRNAERLYKRPGFDNVPSYN